jgi:hypothetical protein
MRTVLTGSLQKTDELGMEIIVTLNRFKLFISEWIALWCREGELLSEA